MTDDELTYEEHMKGKAKTTFFMEDVGSITAEATQLIIDRLEEKGIVTSGDEYFNPIFEVMESVCPNDYRQHM